MALRELMEGRRGVPSQKKNSAYDPFWLWLRRNKRTIRPRLVVLFAFGLMLPASDVGPRVGELSAELLVEASLIIVGSQGSAFT